MKDHGERQTQNGGKVLRLSDAIREAKNASADREDVVVDMREASRMRLEMLAAELEPVFAETPADVDMFDFAISSGLQPRLWIDATAHVAMGRDRRQYRFVRDTRNGRVVMAESHDAKVIAQAVTRHIAERLVERQRLMDGAPEGVLTPVTPEQDDVAAETSAVSGGLPYVLAGALIGAAFIAWQFRDRLMALLPF
ncbi:MAG: hypothetical protein WAT78_08730 [Rhizobiaceae bacterium]